MGFLPSHRLNNFLCLSVFILICLVTIQDTHSSQSNVSKSKVPVGEYTTIINLLYCPIYFFSFSIQGEKFILFLQSKTYFHDSGRCLGAEVGLPRAGPFQEEPKLIITHLNNHSSQLLKIELAIIWQAQLFQTPLFKHLSNSPKLMPK